MHVGERSYDVRADNARTTALPLDRVRILLTHAIGPSCPPEWEDVAALSGSDGRRWLQTSNSRADHVLSNDSKMCLTDQLNVRFEQVLLREELDACTHRVQIIEIHFIDRIKC